MTTSWDLQKETCLNWWISCVMSASGWGICETILGVEYNHNPRNIIQHNVCYLRAFPVHYLFHHPSFCEASVIRPAQIRQVFRWSRTWVSNPLARSYSSYKLSSGTVADFGSWSESLHWQMKMVLMSGTLPQDSGISEANIIGFLPTQGLLPGQGTARCDALNLVQAVHLQCRIWCISIFFSSDADTCQLNESMCPFLQLIPETPGRGHGIQPKSILQFQCWC